ncbi:MAG: energy-coupling factor transporter transmembrane protein EcfT [Magnetococcus sp. XQGC-1]
MRPQAGSGGVLNGDSFLERCDARAKLLALFLFMPIVLSQPILSWGWGGAVLLLILLVQAGQATIWASLWRQVWRFRWFFATLLLLHGLLTPGQPVWPGWAWVTWEGLREGAQQSLRLLILLSLSWMLVRSTTPMQWVVALHGFFGKLERLGVPVREWSAILAFSLGRIPYLVQEARRVGEAQELRRPLATSRGWQARLQRTAQGGEALLFRLLLTARAQEEALLVRGIAHGLPAILPPATPLGWRDWLLLLLPMLIFLGVTLF